MNGEPRPYRDPLPKETCYRRRALASYSIPSIPIYRPPNVLHLRVAYGNILLALTGVLKHALVSIPLSLTLAGRRFRESIVRLNLGN